MRHRRSFTNENNTSFPFRYFLRWWNIRIYLMMVVLLLYYVQSGELYFNWISRIVFDEIFNCRKKFVTFQSCWTRLICCWDYKNRKMATSSLKVLESRYFFDRSLMIGWRKNSWNSERLSSVFTFVSVCLSVCLCVCLYAGYRAHLLTYEPSIFFEKKKEKKVFFTSLIFIWTCAKMLWVKNYFFL